MLNLVHDFGAQDIPAPLRLQNVLPSSLITFHRSMARGAFGDDPSLYGYYETPPVEMAERGQTRYAAEDPR
jgi:hypothetical protein